jgi:hypothetical protein
MHGAEIHRSVTVLRFLEALKDFFRVDGGTGLPPRAF